MDFMLDSISRRLGRIELLIALITLSTLIFYATAFANGPFALSQERMPFRIFLADEGLSGSITDADMERLKSFLIDAKGHLK